MRLLRAATLTVPDCAASATRYAEAFGHRLFDKGEVAENLAASWGTPACVGRPYAIVQPASGAEVFLRFVEGETDPGYRPLRTYGWAAIEICVQDVQAVHDRMRASPFEIIGPPKPLAGLPTILPMQVKGPDQEIVFLTQIINDPPGGLLPRAACPVDSLFIVVLACSDLSASARWFEEHLGFAAGPPFEVVYSTMNAAFGLATDTRHSLLTMTHNQDLFLELDHYPAGATTRKSAPGALPPGVSLATFVDPSASLGERPWLTPPAARAGPFYRGRRSACLRAPDGTLVEVVEGP